MRATSLRIFIALFLVSCGKGSFEDQSENKRINDSSNSDVEGVSETSLELSSSITKHFPTAKREFVKVKGKKFYIGNSLFYIKGVNYYPANYGWTLMWNTPDWNNGKIERTIDRDFWKIRHELGGNVVRIVTQYSEFGAGNPSSKNARKRFQRLDKVLSLAKKHRLRVILTTFDWDTTYEPKYYAAHDRHIDAFINRYKNNYTIFAWDIQNESDHEYAVKNKGSRKDIINFLKRYAKRLKLKGVKQLVSAGLYGHFIGPANVPYSKRRDNAANLSKINDPENLLASFDFVMFHWYKHGSLLTNVMKTLSKKLNKPFFIEELGTPSNGKETRGNCQYVGPQASESIQKSAYASWSRSLKQLNKNSAGVVIWDYIDHRKGTPGACDNAHVRFFGLYRQNGSIKPAGQLFKTEFPMYYSKADAKKIVDGIYRQVLGRKCDPGGCDYYANEMWNKGISITKVFGFLKASKEYQVQRWYKGYLGRNADSGGRRHYLGRLKKGESCKKVALSFLGGVKFQGENGKKFSNDQFIKKLYLAFLHRSADKGGLKFWVGNLNKGMSRHEVTKRFLNSKEFKCR